jgi:hypothetical protein
MNPSPIIFENDESQFSLATLLIIYMIYLLEKGDSKLFNIQSPEGMKHDLPVVTVIIPCHD